MGARYLICQDAIIPDDSILVTNEGLLKLVGLFQNCGNLDSNMSGGGGGGGGGAFLMIASWSQMKIY